MGLQKNLLFRNIFVFVILPFCLLGCSGSNLNSGFQKKYGKEVKKIKLARTPPKRSKKKDVRLNFAPATSNNPDYSADISTSSDHEQYYANVDSNEYSKAPPKRFFPNRAVYLEGKNNPARLPKNMFDITYHTRLSPPFRKSGFEFDLIDIPAQDNYGVRTAMSEKEYLLVGKDSLQHNIDQVNSQRSVEDVEMSKILIKEQRELRRRKKMIRVFGRDSVESQFSKEYDVVFQEDSEGLLSDRENAQQRSDKNLQEVSMLSSNVDVNNKVK